MARPDDAKLSPRNGGLALGARCNMGDAAAAVETVTI